MRKTLMGSVALAFSLAAGGCGSGGDSASTAADRDKLDRYRIDQIEVKWHKAASTKDVDLMMSLWADDATFTIGPKALRGKAEIRRFFEKEAAPFQRKNKWVSETPAYKIRTTIDGNKGTLYFECHYVDVPTRKVVAVVASDQNVARIKGRWLITSAVGATTDLRP